MRPPAPLFVPSVTPQNGPADQHAGRAQEPYVALEFRRERHKHLPS